MNAPHHMSNSTTNSQMLIIQPSDLFRSQETNFIIVIAIVLFLRIKSFKAQNTKQLPKHLLGRNRYLTQLRRTESLTQK